ncbi:MAG: hypothetical protein NVS9B14_02020 [Candidatus Acidiferrum sp.]
MSAKERSKCAETIETKTVNERLRISVMEEVPDGQRGEAEETRESDSIRPLPFPSARLQV